MMTYPYCIGDMHWLFPSYVGHDGYLPLLHKCLIALVTYCIGDLRFKQFALATSHLYWMWWLITLCFGALHWLLLTYVGCGG